MNKNNKIRQELYFWIGVGCTGSFGSISALY